jgi:cytoskeletal protein RodZ
MQSRKGLSARRSLASSFVIVFVIIALLAGAAFAQTQKPNTSQPSAQAQTPAQPAPKTAPAAANPASSDANIISDFDDGKITAKSGFGWAISTDSIMGGQSSAEMKVVAGGAKGTNGALQVTGKIFGASQQAWAGVMYSPGPQPFAPADLSAKKTLSFWAKGDGRGYAVLVFTQSSGYQPAIQTFTAGPEWKEFRIPLASFNGTDGKDITAIMFSAGAPAGDFSFTIDTVSLE